VPNSRNDKLIQTLLNSGKLAVDLSALRVKVRQERTGEYAPAYIRLDRYGYPRITVWHEGRNRTLNLHRILYVAKYGPTWMEVGHMDQDKGNYSLDNLVAIDHQQSEYNRLMRPFAPEKERTQEAPPF
jgi:hypothetical protein